MHVVFAWINFLILVVATLLTWLSYLKSVSPARLAKLIGREAYLKCVRYRRICLASFIIVIANYVLYAFHPLSTAMPAEFSWPWPTSLLIVLVTGIPAVYILIRALMAAGRETLTPRPEHTMYSGIYEKIRHPQALSEIGLWLVFGFVLNSPFLVVYSLVWIPIVVHWCIAEEHDLVIRYGSAYQEYRRRTWALIPGLW